MFRGGEGGWGVEALVPSELVKFAGELVELASELVSLSRKVGKLEPKGFVLVS